MIDFQPESLTDEQIDYMIDAFLKPAIRDAIRQNEKVTNAWQAFFTALHNHAAHLQHEFSPQTD